MENFLGWINQTSFNKNSRLSDLISNSSIMSTIPFHNTIE